MKFRRRMHTVIISFLGVRTKKSRIQRETIVKTGIEIHLTFSQAVPIGALHRPGCKVPRGSGQPNASQRVMAGKDSKCLHVFGFFILLSAESSFRLDKIAIYIYIHLTPNLTPEFKFTAFCEVTRNHLNI